MINKSRSNPKNSLKYALILPLLAGFIFFFNVKTEAQVKSSVTTSSSTTGKAGTTIQKVYQIYKHTTDSQLADLADEIADEGGELDIKNLKRNKRGLISKIAFSYKIDENGNLMANDNNSDGISTIYFGRTSEYSGTFVTGDLVYKGSVLEGSPVSNPNMKKLDTTITKFTRKYGDGTTINNTVKREVDVNNEEKLYLNGKETTREELKQEKIYLDGEVLAVQLERPKRFKER